MRSGSQDRDRIGADCAQHDLRAWFKDIRVRRALLHAIDRKTTVKTLFKGVQPVAHSLVAERHVDLWPLVKDKLGRYPYDPGTLRLLNEAGWKKGSDGRRQ